MILFFQYKVYKILLIFSIKNMNNSFSYANKYVNLSTIPDKNNNQKSIVPTSIIQVRYYETRIICYIVKYLNQSCIMCQNKNTVTLTSKTGLNTGLKYNHNICKCSNCNQTFVINLGINPDHTNSTIDIIFNVNNQVYKEDRDIILRGDISNNIYLLGAIIDNKVNILKFNLLGLFSLYFGNNTAYSSTNTISNTISTNSTDINEAKYFITKLNCKPDYCELKIGDIIECKDEAIDEEIKKLI